MLAVHTGVALRLLLLVTLCTLLLLVMAGCDTEAVMDVGGQLVVVDVVTTDVRLARLAAAAAVSVLPACVTGSGPNQDEECLRYVRVNYITGQTRAAQVVTAIRKRLLRVIQQYLSTRVFVCRIS